MRPAFEYVLAAAAVVARRAPSSHNCQPWSVFELVDPDARRPFEALAEADGAPLGDAPLLVLALDRRRALGTLAAHDAEMMMSCGMYLHLLLAILASEGWISRTLWRVGQPLPTVPGWPAEHEPLYAVAAIPGPPVGDQGEIAHCANRRITNRAPYLDEPLPAADLAAIPTPRTPLDPEARLRVEHHTERPVIAAHGAFVGRHAGIDFADDAAWAETHRYIRFTEGQLSRTKDGFALTQLFGPLGFWRRLMMRLALAPLTMRILKHVGYPRIIAGQLGGLVAGSPATVTLATVSAEPDRAELIVAGGLVLDYWLQATEAELVMHPVSVILQHEPIRQAFTEAFDLDGRVVFFARLGRPTAEFRPTRRRTPGDVMECI